MKTFEIRCDCCVLKRGSAAAQYGDPFEIEGWFQCSTCDCDMCKRCAGERCPYADCTLAWTCPRCREESLECYHCQRTACEEHERHMRLLCADCDVYACVKCYKKPFTCDHDRA